MRPKGNARKLEARRHLAARLLDDGLSVADVASTVGVSESSVRRWKSARERRGAEALQAKPHPGPSRRLSAKQERALMRALQEGDQATGLTPGDWNCSTVADYIEARFGIDYHVDHVWRLLRRMGWTYWEGSGWRFEPRND